MSFCTLTLLCSHYLYIVAKYFYWQKPISFCLSALCLPSLHIVQDILCLNSFTKYVFEVHSHYGMYYYFILFYESIFYESIFLCVYNIVFIHSSVDGHLSYLPVFPIIYSAAMNIPI